MLSNLIARLANSYARLLLAIAMLLFVSSLTLHASVLMGREEPYERFGMPLYAATLLAAIPITLFAKDRDLWKNEFKSCPRWLQTIVVILAVYGAAISSLQFIFFSDGLPFSRQSLALTAIPLGLDSIFLCVLYAALWSGFIDQSELIRRARKSAITTTLVAIFIVAYRAGYLHRPGK